MQYIDKPQEARLLGSEVSAAITRLTQLDANNLRHEAQQLESRLIALDLPPQLRLYLLETLNNRAQEQGRIGHQTFLTTLILQSLSEIMGARSGPASRFAVRAGDLRSRQLSAKYARYAAGYERDFSLLAYMQPQKAQTLAPHWFSLIDATWLPLLHNLDSARQLTDMVKTDQADPLLQSRRQYWQRRAALALRRLADNQKTDEKRLTANRAATAWPGSAFTRSASAKVHVFLPLSGPLERYSDIYTARAFAGLLTSVLLQTGAAIGWNLFFTILSGLRPRLSGAAFCATKHWPI